MAVRPHSQPSTQKRMDNAGKYINDRAHAERWEKGIEQQRRYQQMKTQPKEFNKEQKKEIRHRHEFGRTREQTVQKLKQLFLEGKLPEKAFKEFKHATGIDENWGDYTSYSKFKSKGLSSLSSKEFKKANKIANFDFGTKEFEAYKKGKTKGIHNLSENEYKRLKKVPGVGITKKQWKKAKNVNEAKERGLISEKKSGQLNLEKNVTDLGKGDVSLLKKIGMDVPGYPTIESAKKLEKKGLASLSFDEVKKVNNILGETISKNRWQKARNIKEAKQKKLIKEQDGELKLKKPLGKLSSSERELLDNSGFNIDKQKWNKAKDIQKAKDKGLIKEKEDQLKLKEEMEDLDKRDVEQLKNIGFGGLDYSEIKAYQKMLEGGLASLTWGQAQKADEVTDEDITKSEWEKSKQVQKAEDKKLIVRRGEKWRLKKPFGKLSSSEKKLLDRIGFDIKTGDWKKARNVQKAEDKKLIKEQDGELKLKKTLGSLSSSERKILNNAGFDIGKQEWENAKNIQKAKNKGLVKEQTVQMKSGNIPVDRPTSERKTLKLKKPIGKLSSSERKILNNAGFDIGKQEWENAKKVAKAKAKAKEKRIIKEQNGRLNLKKPLGKLSSSEKRLLNDAGFDISNQRWKDAKNIQAAKSKRLIKEQGDQLKLRKSLRHISDLERKLLNKVGFDISKSMWKQAKNQQQPPGESWSSFGGISSGQQSPSTQFGFGGMPSGRPKLPKKQNQQSSIGGITLPKESSGAGAGVSSGKPSNRPKKQNQQSSIGGITLPKESSGAGAGVSSSKPSNRPKKQNQQSVVSGLLSGKGKGSLSLGVETKEQQKIQKKNKDNEDSKRKNLFERIL